MYFLFWGSSAWLFFQNEGDLGVLEEAANEAETLKTVRTPDNWTPKEYRVEGGAGDCAVPSRPPVTVFLSAEPHRL